MKFIKENSYILSRLIVTQIGMMIFSTILSFAFAGFGGIQIFIGIFSVLFHFVLIHAAIWTEGAKDVIRVEGGRQKPSQKKGLLLGLVAATPTLLVVLLMAIGYLFGYSAMNTDFGMGLYAVTHIIGYFLQAPYLSIISSMLSTSTVASLPVCFAFGIVVEPAIYWLLRLLFLFISVLPAIFMTGLSYYLGYKNIYLLSPNPNKKKPNKPKS